MTIRQFLFGFVLCLVSPTVFSVWLSRTWRNTQQVGGNDTRRGPEPPPAAQER